MAGETKGNKGISKTKSRKEERKVVLEAVIWSNMGRRDRRKQMDKLRQKAGKKNENSYSRR